ncbi:MAG: carboxypeptidase regulatory-like domain-containing protein, partial [Halanaerobiales bacterium]|nr:carboxypeptidase regulatory-like domain-containing protein [Halanaerobiales bacterium]
MKSKNLFKKLSVLALVFIMIFALAACSNDTATEDDTPTVTEYAVNFTVVDEEDAAVQGAEVTLNGTTKTTDSSGVVSFDKVDGTYSFTVTADDFENAAGDVTVDGAEVSVDVTMEAVDEGTPPESAAVTVASESEFMDALGNKAEGITLSAGIMFNSRVVVDYNLEYLDLNGNTITMTEGNPLVFRGNGTVVSNGTIYGEDVIGSWENYLADEEWPFQGSIEFSASVLMDGRDIHFDGIYFETKVFDWYQDQEGAPASGVTFTDTLFGYYAIFVSDVTIEDSTVAYRLGIDNDDAVLNEVSFIKHPGSGYYDLVEGNERYGILYVAGDAELNDITWADNFTGMYVGKSLKWNLTENMYLDYPDKAYRKAKPTLTNADVLTDKDGMVWWGINYDKATLTVNGTVNVVSEQGRNGLTLVGTDYRDYGEAIGRPDNDYNGGQIYGNATFVGADVHFGWQTG